MTRKRPRRRPEAPHKPESPYRPESNAQRLERKYGPAERRYSPAETEVRERFPRFTDAQVRAYVTRVTRPRAPGTHSPKRETT